MGRKFYRNETPLTVGIGLSIHSTTGSRKVVEKVSDLALVNNYSKVLSIQESMLQYVLTSCFENGVFIPPTIILDTRIFCALNNFDLSRDTKDGKSQWHFTVITLFQNASKALDPYLQASLIKLLRGK